MSDLNHGDRLPLPAVEPAEVRQLIVITRAIIRDTESRRPPREVQDLHLGAAKRYEVPVGRESLYVFVPNLTTNPFGGVNPEYSVRTYPGNHPFTVGWRIDLFPDGHPAAWNEDQQGIIDTATEPYMTARELLQLQHLPPASSQ